MKKEKKNYKEENEEPVFTGIIHKDKPKVTPCQCPHCGAIFLYHGDIISAFTPCPNCNMPFQWVLWTISPMKYKFLRYWRMRDGEA